MGWYDAPIPAANILDGEPRTRSWNLHHSRRSGTSMNYWDCTAGRFTWHFHGDEYVQILEGEVHITDETGATRTLRAGDTDLFRAGESHTWHVPEYLRKLAFHRSPQTLPDRALTKLLRMRPVVPALGAGVFASAIAVAL